MTSKFHFKQASTASTG